MMDMVEFDTEKVLIVDSQNFLILVPGAWAVWNNPLNLAAGEAVARENLASVLMYGSRRYWDAMAVARNENDVIRAHDGKTYDDELSELREKIDYVQKTYHPKNLFISGRSFGGGLAALVSGDKIPNLSKVLLVSPQIDVDNAIDHPTYTKISHTQLNF